MPKPITPTALAYFHICPRKMWLSHNSITMEQTSDLVYEGKMIGEYSYQQRSEKYRELQLEYAKIDHYDHKNKVVHEVKKSDKMDHAHIAQTKYYLYLLETELGIVSPTAIIEYPKLRTTHKIAPLNESDRQEIEDLLISITDILSSDICPPKLEKKSKCSACSYFEFCWVEE